MTSMQKEMRVSGMSCEGCESAVAAALRQVDEVVDVDADHRTGKVSVRLRSEVDDASLAEKIAEAGFEVD